MDGWLAATEGMVGGGGGYGRLTREGMVGGHGRVWLVEAEGRINII
jgi:hypothetical protein